MIIGTNLALAVGHFRQRLLDAARAVEEFDHSHDKHQRGLVHMSRYTKPCGSPACVLGHYALRRDLQNHFTLVLGMLCVGDPCPGQHYRVDCDSKEVRAHFGLTWDEATDLFSSTGCGIKHGSHEWDYGVEAARVVAFVRAFVTKKYPQWERTR